MSIVETTVETEEFLWGLTKSFASGVRSHFEQTLDGEPTLMVDRVCAAGAALAAAIVIIAPIKGKDKYATVLFTAATRLWNRRGQ